MGSVTVNDLPKYSPWPARILGLEPWEKVVRAPEYVADEYREKYWKLRNCRTIQEARRRELGTDEVVVSRGSFLSTETRFDAGEISVRQVVQWIVHVYHESHEVSSILDLGCGYGYLLKKVRDWLSDPYLYGFDGSSLAVELGERLCRDDPNFTIVKGDLNSDSYPLLEVAPKPVIVTHSYALHQLDSAGTVVDTLSRYREKIHCVVSFEPEENEFGDDLLGLMRSRYGEMNGYSADILRVLRARSDVQIQVLNPNAFGQNALLPATLVVWRFK